MTVTEVIAKEIAEVKDELEAPAHPSEDGKEAEEVPMESQTEIERSKRTLTSKKSSVLAASDDPFAPREGKTLLWRNVNMTLVRKSVGTEGTS